MMSKPSIREQIKQVAKKPFKTCYKCYQDLEEGKTDGVPDCCNDCELFQEWVPLAKIMGLLDGCVVIKEEKLQELENDIIGYLNDYDTVKFLEQNNVKYDPWLKNQFFKLVTDIRTEIIMKFSKFVELTKETKKQ